MLVALIFPDLRLLITHYLSKQGASLEILPKAVYFYQYYQKNILVKQYLLVFDLISLPHLVANLGM